MEETRLREFGNKYTAAWCSQNPASVAAFFMTAFPDMVVRMDSVSIEERQPKRRTTLDSEIVRREAGAFRDPGEHARTDFLVVVECEDEIRP
jgi:hypothetical protein